MLYAIERFNHCAAKQNLSAGAILLWQYLYFTMHRKGVFADVMQNTSVLTAMLDVTRQGLQAMRQTLIDKGFLSIRQDEHQQIYYTLLLNGSVVGEKSADTPARMSNAAGTGAAGTQFCAGAYPQTESEHKSVILSEGRRAGVEGSFHPDEILRFAQNDMSSRTLPSGDIILTSQYRPYIEAFCDRFGSGLQSELLQWAEMRKANGWTLTLWGLEEVLKKLIALAGGCAAAMAEIVKQSVKRRWKGFYELKVKPKPSGAKLIRQEEKQQKAYQKPWAKSSPIQKFKPEGRDLSFLER